MRDETQMFKKKKKKPEKKIPKEIKIEWVNIVDSYA
jgi:hypothetical protein